MARGRGLNIALRSNQLGVGHIEAIQNSTSSEVVYLLHINVVKLGFRQPKNSHVRPRGAVPPRVKFEGSLELEIEGS